MSRSLTCVADERAVGARKAARVCDHPRVHRRGRGKRTKAALVALLLLAALPASASADALAVSAQIGSTPSGQAMGQGFIGFSFEYRALHLYTGRDPTAVNPVLIRLLRGVAPDQHPVIRIGGISTDGTWWPIRGMIPPGGIRYGLTNGWLRLARTVAQTLGAHMIMGINLAGGRPAIAAAEARAIMEGIGSSNIQALEIGNEPDVYGIFAWYIDRNGHFIFARPHTYSLTDFIADFSRWRAVLPPVTLAGPASSSIGWMSSLGTFLSDEPSVRIVTLHRYPLRGCVTDPTDPLYPSIPNLLSDASSTGMAQLVAPFVSAAHAFRDRFRIDELNSATQASCLGRPTVSAKFASALWMLDTLFNMAAVGVDGVNVHTLPGSTYEPFSFTKSGKTWSAFVHPVYYGLLMFAQAFPPGAQLLPVSAPAGAVKIWATQGTDGTTRAVVINKSTDTPATVQLQLPGPPAPAGAESLLAPSVSATTGITLGGQSFGTRTTTGTLPGIPQLSQINPDPTTGTYTLALPPASAVLLTR